MNLNKYHSSGRLYTAEEAEYRAMALLRANTFYPASRKPYNDGRNAEKRRLVSRTKQMAKQEFA